MLNCAQLCCYHSPSLIPPPYILEALAVGKVWDITCGLKRLQQLALNVVPRNFTALLDGSDVTIQVPFVQPALPAEHTIGLGPFAHVGRFFLRQLRAQAEIPLCAS